MPNEDNIYNEVMGSKKYSGLYEPLVKRICEEEHIKYKNNSDRVKAVKTKLHLLYGAFLKQSLREKANILLDKGDIDGILRLHSSTLERIGHYKKFYEYIFKYAASGTILDIGCGYNPLSVSYMPEKPAFYYAFDIDYNIAAFIRRYFEISGLSNVCGCMDVITETPRQAADTAFLFKLLPVIESQKPGRGLKLLKELKVKNIVATYPTKSLGGKNKGMRKNYSSAFENMVSGEFEIINSDIVGDELIYILTRHTHKHLPFIYGIMKTLV